MQLIIHDNDGMAVIKIFIFREICKQGVDHDNGHGHGYQDDKDHAGDDDGGEQYAVCW